MDCRILFPMPSAALNLCRSLEEGRSEGCELMSRSFDLSHFSNSDAEHLCIGFVAISMPPFKIHPFRSLASFFSWVDCILLLSCRSCLHVLEMNTLLLNSVAFSP